MTSWIGLLSVFADVVILVALTMAVASPGVSQLARPVIATFAFVCAWLLAAGSDAIGARGWTTFVGGAVIVVCVVMITATLHLWTQGGDGGDAGPGHRGAHGGGGPRRRRPDAPQPGGGSAPSWWPDFERQFAVYVVERERQEPEPATVPAEPTPDARHAAGLTPCASSLRRAPTPDRRGPRPRRT